MYNVYAAFRGHIALPNSTTLPHKGNSRRAAGIVV